MAFDASTVDRPSNEGLANRDEAGAYDAFNVASKAIDGAYVWGPSGRRFRRPVES